MNENVLKNKTYSNKAYGSAYIYVKLNKVCITIQW